MVTWTDLETSLAVELREMTDRCILIIEGADGPASGFVQFTVVDDLELLGSCPGRSVKGFDRLDESADASFLDAGWSGPDPTGMWTWRLDLPATTDRFAAVAAGTVAALQDIYGVAAERLVYQAWREPEMMREGHTYSQEEMDQLDPGEVPMSLPRLGIPSSHG